METGFVDESSLLTERFFIGLMYKGPSWTTISANEQEKLEEDHLEYLRNLQKSGKLVAAGPTPSNEDLICIFLYRADAIEEAAGLALADPLVRSQLWTCDLYPWVLPVGIIQDLNV